MTLMLINFAWNSPTPPINLWQWKLGGSHGFSNIPLNQIYVFKMQSEIVLYWTGSNPWKGSFEQVDDEAWGIPRGPSHLTYALEAGPYHLMQGLDYKQDDKKHIQFNDDAHLSSIQTLPKTTTRGNLQSSQFDTGPNNPNRCKTMLLTQGLRWYELRLIFSQPTINTTPFSSPYCDFHASIWVPKKMGML